jgi:APA family basic amino acid/polyamine antiporter
MSDEVDRSPEDTTSGAAGVPTARDKAAGTLGLSQATALIVGSIIGVGIFNLPGSLAAYGPISLFAMALTTVGALALAVLFAEMSRRLPADGGPYAYARSAFGNMAGFSNAWLYWITAWAGNAAIVVGWVLYVQEFVNEDAEKLYSILLALVGLWIPAAINLSGVKNMGSVQVWTSILKFIPLVFMSTVGLFFISSGNFTPWNVSGDSNISAIGGAMALCLFSYLGVETAAVAAAKVKDPDRNVPRATIFGTLATAVVYMLSLIAVFGIVGSAALGDSTAPFSTAADEIFGGSWAGNVMAALVIISGFGALNGWTMICAEMPLAAAKDGLFPDRFGRLSDRGVPWFGIVASTVLASVAMVFSYAGSAGYTVFNTLVFMSGITAAIPYGFSALAQIKWRVQDNRPVHTPRFARDVGIAVVSLVFSILFIWYSRNTGEDVWEEYLPFVFAGVAFLLGIPIYLAQRTRMTPPQPVPPYRP